jgi:Holliday junction resolvase RusA-like endonuclease
MNPTISFFVQGLPKPAGSKRAFVLKRGGVYTGRAIVTDDCKKSRDWKTDVSITAKMHYGNAPLLDGPLELTLTFYMPRPKGHFGSGRNAATLKASSQRYPQGKPDVLKLARAVEDALTGVCWIDDALICHEVLRKEYEHTRGIAGVQVQIRKMEG